MIASGDVRELPLLESLLRNEPMTSSVTPTLEQVAEEYFRDVDTQTPPVTSSPTSEAPVTSSPPQQPPMTLSQTPQPMMTSSPTSQYPVIISSTPPAPVIISTSPVIGSFYRDSRRPLLVKDDEFPPDDAIENILPEYLMTSDDLQLHNVPTNATINKQQIRKPDNSDKRRIQVILDQRERELARYKDAVKRMSRDIVNLRQENLSLRSNNQVLRHENEDYVTYRGNAQPEVNPNDSSELVQELEAANEKLLKESIDLQKYKSKVQHLQNQVIKANDREKNYLNKEMTRKQLESMIGDLQEKLKKMPRLEETVLKQEKVILKMEDLLKKTQKKDEEQKKKIQDLEDDLKKATSSSSSPRQRLSSNEETLASLTKQNNRLHLDLRRANEAVELEKSELLVKLERAENRATSLEEQLVKNAKEWAREKQELMVRLQEHRNGIIRKNQ